MSPILLTMSALLATQGQAAQPDAGATPSSAIATSSPQAKPGDVATPEAAVHAVYEIISGEAGTPRDWDRLRSLFLPSGTMTSTGVDKKTGAITTHVRSLEEYISRGTDYVASKGFFEIELASRTQRYGNIAHIFSTYASREHASDRTPFDRGINSIELVSDGKRWWILGISWTTETPVNPLPPMYLHNASRN